MKKRFKEEWTIKLYSKTIMVLGLIVVMKLNCGGIYREKEGLLLSEETITLDLSGVTNTRRVDSTYIMTLLNSPERI